MGHFWRALKGEREGVFVKESPLLHQAHGASGDGEEQRLDFVVVGRRQQVEARRFGALGGGRDEETLEHQDVEVGIESECAREALLEADGTRLSIEAQLSGSRPQEAEEGAQEEGADVGHQAGITGQVPANPLRVRERPLPKGSSRQDFFHEVGGGVMGPARVAGRADAALLAGEGHEQLVAAVPAAHPCEPPSEYSALEVADEVSFDVARLTAGFG